MRTKLFSVVMLLALMMISCLSYADALKDIEKAGKEGKSIYIVVTDKNAKGTDALLKLTASAQKAVKNTVVVTIDRDDKANAGLIAKYRLSGAPLPLVLVVAFNGVVSGSLTVADATAEKLVSYLPSKNQAEVLLGFENGKAAFIICGKKNAKGKTMLEEECKKAMVSLGNKATLVFVDIDNKEEANFLALIKPDLAKTTIIIFNGKGQYTGTFENTAKSEELVKSVNKKIGGCSPGSCGTKKC